MKLEFVNGNIVNIGYQGDPRLKFLHKLCRETLRWHEAYSGFLTDFGFGIRVVVRCGTF